MAEATRATKKRRWTIVLAMIALFTVIGPVCCCWSWWNQSPDFVWALFRDSREYPRVDGPMHITKGDGDLEKDLLPHFLVKLPCGVEHLRFAEWEDYGSMGQLFLHFDTSPECLDAFLRHNALFPTENFTFPPLNVPKEYGWTIYSSNSTYVGTPSESVRLSASVDLRSGQPSVYVISEHR
ncbi:hypothetical protein AB0M47_00910 [Hamadaea sp. NPDC051192]|uniref:hypothetical protein n=1 Tax=Hamadaea sp. NPDC051192 TaxID=3154940 RepID=UPI00343F98F8